MKEQCQSSDRITALPQDTIEKILTLMPIQDALRTSVLSKKWRYHWTTMPKIVIDYHLVLHFLSDIETHKIKLVSAIFHVLLLHKGPILDFVICMADTHIFNAFDQIILHLSRSNYIKKFSFEIWAPDPRYKLPSFFFSLHGLEHIDLTDCVFEPPLTFKGFSMLKNLRFYNVDITAKTLLRFLTGCPLLEEFKLIGDQNEFVGGNIIAFVGLFKCLPSVQVLEMSEFYMEHFAVGGMPHKLPISLVHLRILVLDLCFLELSSALCVINSSPNLEKIKVEICSDHDQSAQQNSKYLVDPQDYSGLNLDHLEELELTGSYISAHEMAFVKLIMAKSPVLKKARMELNKSVSVDEEVQMFRDLLLLPFPRASQTAKFVIERPKKLHVNAKSAFEIV